MQARNFGEIAGNLGPGCGAGITAGFITEIITKGDTSRREN